MKPELPDGFGAKVVLAMSRGTVVLDETDRHLLEALKNINLKVVLPDRQLSDQSIKQLFLSGRILITSNSKDFLSDAPIYEYGIVALEHVQVLTPEQIAQKIHRALVEFELTSRNYGYVVRLYADKPSQIQVLN